MTLYYYYEELTLREIDEVLGVTESHVSRLNTNTILRLKAHLGAARGPPRRREGPLERAFSSSLRADYRVSDCPRAGSSSRLRGSRFRSELPGLHVRGAEVEACPDARHD